MENNNTQTTYSITTILFLIFLFLKLGEFGAVANWSWWWVTAPLWIPFAAALVVVLIISIFDKHE